MKTIQFQLALTLGDDAAQTLAELLGPAIRRVMTPAVEHDEKSAARLRASQHAILGGQKPPEDQGILIDSRQTAKLLKVSEKTIWTMQKTGRMPTPIRIGRAVRWSLKVVEKWVEDGCPAAKK